MEKATKKSEKVSSKVPKPAASEGCTSVSRKNSAPAVRKSPVRKESSSNEDDDYSGPK